MTFNAQIWLLALVFFAQIIVLSFIAPARMIGAYGQMFERYPPEQFARLYPVSIEEMRRWQRVRKTLHLLIGYAGFVVLVAALILAEGSKQFSFVMTVFTIVQLLPALYMATQHRKLFKEVAKMAPPAKRSAPLHPWRLADFVSPLSIALGFIGTATAIGTAAYLYFIDSAATFMLAFSTIVSIVLLVRMLQLVFLPLKFTRPDPYMAQTDMFLRRRQRLRILFRAGAILGSYLTFMMLYAERKFSIDFAYISAGISILVQVLSLRMSALVVRLLESTDFSVYKDTGSLPSGDRPSVVSVDSMRT